MDLREKLNYRIDTLQEMLENNEHLDKPIAAENLIHRISPFWSILSEEERDYVQCAQHAIEDGVKWGKP
mgnify:FL=1